MRTQADVSVEGAWVCRWWARLERRWWGVDGAQVVGAAGAQVVGV